SGCIRSTACYSYSIPQGAKLSLHSPASSLGPMHAHAASNGAAHSFARHAWIPAMSLRSASHEVPRHVTTAAISLGHTACPHAAKFSSTQPEHSGVPCAPHSKKHTPSS